MTSWMVWAGCVLAAAVATMRQGVILSVGAESLTIPLLVAATNLPLAVLLELQRRMIVKIVPVWSAVMANVPPLLVLGLVWVPGLLARAPEVARSPSAAATGPSVVLVTLDSFRADMVGAIGGGNLTPNLDGLAAQGMLFTQAVTTAPLSGPAHASMLTGRGVLEHGLTMNGAAVKIPTIVDEVREKGYRTGAFISAQVVDRDSGMHIGFTHFDDRWGLLQRLAWLPAVSELPVAARPPRRSGEETVDRALRWFGAHDSPAFLWVHLYDTHGPYAPTPEFAPSADALEEARRMDREDLRRRGDVGMIGNRARTRVREQTLLYTASLRWVDALVGRLAAALPADAVLIVVGDHGESLGEHDYYFSHGQAVWEQAIAVPMVVRWPGRFQAGERFDGLTSVAGVARLVREATGLDPVAPLQAERSVFVYTTGQDARRVEDAEELDARSPPTACVRRDHAKVMRRGADPAVYFDLAADPAEANALPVPPELANDVAILDQVLSKPVPRLDDAQRAHLEALGYRE